MIHHAEQTVAAESVQPQLFRHAMRGLAGGVVIVATGTAEKRRGLTATSVCSLSDTPPSVLVSIQNSAETLPAILENGSFSMNIVAVQHAELVNRFAGRHGAKGVEKFESGSWYPGLTGSPVLRDAVASLDCIVDRIFDGGTHTIIVGVIRDIAHDTSRKPLIYHAGSFGTVSMGLPE